MHSRQFSLMAVAVALVSRLACGGDIVKCKIDDEECLVRVANEVLSGRPEGLDTFNLPALDPLRIDELSIIQDLNAVKIDASILDTDMPGFQTARISKFSGLHTGSVEIKFVIKSGGFIGPYRIKGKLLKLTIEGKGNMKITFKNMDTTLRFKVTNKTVDGKTYLHASDPRMTLSITGGTAHLSHLGSLANSFLNWSFVVIVNAVKDTFCKPMSAVFLTKINSMFDTIPVDELFEQ